MQSPEPRPAFDPTTDEAKQLMRAARVAIFNLQHALHPITRPEYYTLWNTLFNAWCAVYDFDCAANPITHEELATAETITASIECPF